MTARTCPRLFEAEALRDGRLAGAERASFERHLVNCTACAREAEALDALGRALALDSPPDADELLVRRQRTQLLADFDRSLTSQRARWAGPRALVAVGVTLAVGVLCFVLWRRAESSDLVAASSAVVQAQTDARWSRRTDSGRELVVLESGSLRIRVHQVPGARSFAVMLPDGELEDIGTTFSVEVADGRTESVHVDEGRVLLRLRGQAPVVLDAGQTWRAARTAELPPPPSARQPSEPGEPMRPEAPEPEHARPARPPASTLAVPPPRGSAPRSLPSASRSSEPVGSQVSEQFRTALAALNAGQPRTAAQEFERFSEAYPSDPRAEDAAYLRVLALERAGDVSARRAAARAYLRRYPSGFRRSEVERLAR